MVLSVIRLWIKPREYIGFSSTIRQDTQLGPYAGEHDPYGWVLVRSARVFLSSSLLRDLLTSPGTTVATGILMILDEGLKGPIAGFRDA
jgi:hypothetical protein